MRCSPARSSSTRTRRRPNAFQKNDNLLLSDDAEIDTKPELEIYADDVKCSHGATCGDLDPMALFYLRSRGLPRATAESVLTFAFAAEVIERFADPTVRQHVRKAAVRRGCPAAPPWRSWHDRRCRPPRHRSATTSPGCARDFPILATPDERPAAGLSRHGGQRAEAAGGDRHAASASTSSDYANIHRGVYDLSQRATAADDAARRKVQRFVNAADWREIVFTRNATEAINLVAASFLRPRLQPGDEILVTEMEHHANIVPWQLRAPRRPVRRWWRRRSPKRASSILDAFVERITERTRMIAVVWVSNVLGTVNPVARAGRARARAAACRS